MYVVKISIRQIVKLNGKKNKKAVLKEGDCIKIGLEEFYFKQD